MATPAPSQDLLQIAAVCHEANRAYCLTIGDVSQPDWPNAPEWQRASALHGVELHWTALSGGREPDPAESHDAWLQEKRLAGWRYGPFKDAEKKEHPCFVPYGELPSSQKVKDYIFIGVVKAFFAAAHTQHS